MRIGLGAVLACAALGLGAVLSPIRAAEEPHRGGTLIYSVSNGEPETFDCHAAQSSSVFHRVLPHYSTLLKIDPATYPAIVGDLAQSWSISPDGLTYEFKLTPDVKFHDGSVLTSADIKATFDRLRNPAKGTISRRQELYRAIATIDTPDPLTVVFHLSQPDAAMLTYMASPMNCVYSAKMLAQDPDYPARKVMGTGPFKFVHYIAGSEWQGERFDGYFRKGQPYLDGFKAMSLAGAAAVNALSSGQVLSDFRSLTPPQRDRIVAARGDKVKVLETNQPNGMLYFANGQRPLFNDDRVRQALALAIDHWGGSVAMTRLNYYNQAGGMLRLGTPFALSKEELQKLPGFKPDMAANRAEAKRLLAEAGQTNLKFTLLNIDAYSPLGVFLIDQWRQIGVAVTHDVAERTRFYADRDSGNFDIVTGAIDTMDDPSPQLNQFISFDRNPTNTARSVDRTVDELFDKQSKTLDPASRKEIVGELEKRLLTKAYSEPIFWAQRIVTLDSKVHGYVLAPLQTVGQDFSTVWMDP